MKDSFPKNLTKGKIAETIFWLMFRDTYFTVLPFGYERVIPELAQIHRPDEKGIKHTQDKIVGKISTNPDFVLIAPDKTIYLIDVKYSQDPHPRRLISKAKETIKEWADCYYFIATPIGFFLDKCQAIAAGKTIFNPLSTDLINEETQKQYTNLLNEFIKI